MGLITYPRQPNCISYVVVCVQICWWAEAYRWWGEHEPSAACRGRPPCERCRERACSCGLLKPARGALPHAHVAEIRYDVNAPEVLT